MSSASVPNYIVHKQIDRALRKTCSAHLSNSALEEINIFVDQVIKYFVDSCPMELLVDLTIPHNIMKNLVDNPKILKACENHAITKCCEVASGLSLNISAITPKLDKSIITRGNVHQYRANLLEQLRYFCSQYISFGPRGNIPSNQSSNQHFSLLVGVFISQVLEYIINTIISEISVFSLKHDETKILNNQLTYIITSNTQLIRIADLSRFFDRNDYEEELKSSISVNSGSNTINNVYTLKSTDSSESLHSFTSSISHSESHYEKPHEPKWSILKGLRMFKESINSVSHTSKSKLLNSKDNCSIKNFYNSQFNYSENDFKAQQGQQQHYKKY